MDTDESELIGEVTITEAPKQEPTDTDCRGKKKLKRDGETVTNAVGTSMFGGYCGCWPGKGTDHVGEGRCSRHGGNAPKGEDNGNFKHGLYSDVVREEDRGTLKKIEEMTTAAKLESTLNMQMLKLHRAVEEMEDSEQGDFWRAFAELVDKIDQPEEADLRSLAQMLGQNDRAIREWMDLIRKTAKDLHKITDGETVTVEGEVGVDTDALEEVRDLVSDAY